MYMLERLKIAWYALTKKEYVFYGVDRRDCENSGAVAYCKTSDTKGDTLFLSTIQAHIEILKSQL